MTQKRPASKPAPESPAPKKRRRLWTWTKRLVLAAVAVVIAGRIALPWVLPSILDAVASGYGLTARYESLDLSILGGEVQLRRLQVAARPPEEHTDEPLVDPYVDLEFAYVDVDVSALWSGTLRLQRVEIDGLDMRLERDADGHVPFLEHFAAAPEDAPAPEPEPATEPTPVDLSFPVRVDALRVQHTRVRVVDRAASPAVDTWIEGTLRVTDLGAPDRNARVEITAYGPELLDHFSVQGSVASSSDELRARFDLALHGAHPKPATAWLESLGITPRADALDAGAALTVTATPNDEDPTTVDADVQMTRIALLADAEEAAAVDSVKVLTRRAGPRGLELPEVSLSGVRGRAARLPDGALYVAGLELRPVASPPAAPASEEAATPAAPQDGAIVTVGLAQVDDVELAFRDESVVPVADLSLLFDEVRLRDVVADPQQPEASATLTLKARAPGVAESVTVDARLAPFGIRKSIEADVQATEVTLDAVAPYLAELGLEPTLESGTATLHVRANARSDTDGATRAALVLSELALRDGDAELVGLDRISVDGVVASPASVRVGEVTVRGTRVPVRRAADGALHVAGLRTVTATPTKSPQPSATPDAPAATGPMPQLELGALRVRDTALTFVDETRKPQLRAATSALEVDVENLALGGPPDGPAHPPATIRVRLRSEGVAEELGLRGSVVSRPGPLDVHATLEVSGDRLAAGPFLPYLENAGIEPTLEAGQLRASILATVRQTEEGLRAEGRIADVVFQDGDQDPFVSLAEVRVDEVVLSTDGIRVGQVHVREPHLRAARAADGSLEVLGLRFRPAQSAAPHGATGPRAPVPADAAATPEPAAAGPRLSIERVQVDGARLAWRDAAVGDEPVETVLGCTVSLEQLDLAPGAEAAKFELTADAEGALEEARIEGTVALDPSDLRATAQVDARGLHAGALDAYLPPGVALTLADGRFRAELEARVASVEAGGSSIEATLSAVDLRDGEDGEPLFACDAVRVRAPRIDPAGKTIQVAEVAVVGTRARARLTESGATELLGLSLSAPPPGATPPSPEAPDPDVAASAPAAEIDRSETPPRVVVEKLDIELAQLRFDDDSTGTDTPPIEMRARLFAPDPLVLLDAEPENLPPIALRLEAAADPIVESVVAVVQAAPWPSVPEVDATLDVTGLRGAAIPEVLPSLADRVDGSDLDGGSLTAKLHAELELRRRTPTDIDLSRGFGVRAAITDVAFRATPKGEVLAGIEEIDAYVPRIAPDGSVHVAQLDVSGLRGRVRRSTDGLHALGLQIRPPASPANAPAAENVAASEPPPPAAPDAPAAAAPAAPEGPELRIDHLGVFGLDFVYQDDSADPPMTLPLDGLELEVARFTTRAFEEPRPIRFLVSVTGGDAELPKRQAASSILTGLLGAVTDVVTGGSDEVELQERPIFEEIAVSGRVALYPHLVGRVRTSAAQVELTALRGAAKQSGIEIGDGVLDAGVTLDFHGAQGTDVEATFTFDSLQIDEPPGGPISSYLKLPAPLNTVIFTLKDNENRIQIPLSTHVEETGIGSGRLTRAIITALGSVIKDAIASAPFRVTGTVTSALGLDSLFGGSDTPLEDLVATVDFAPGATALSPDGRRPLDGIVELLQDDEEVGVVLVHTFGEQDLERARTLANPTPEQTRALVARLRQQRAELTRERAIEGANARAILATGDPETVQQTVHQLQALDRELGRTELALDRALDLLRPGAERYADRRTRTAALEIGNLRLEAVRRALVQLLGPEAAERIETKRARFTDPVGDAGGRVTIVPRARPQG